MKKFAWIILLAVSLVFGCDHSPPAASKPPAAPTSVQVILPKQGAITRAIVLPGTVKAWQEATLFAKVSGYLKTIAVDKGDQVFAGNLLAELEVPELLADRARYKAEVDVGERDFTRLSASQQKLPDLVVLQTVDDARGRFEVAQAALARTETLLGFARITAPFDGIVTRRMVDPGAFIPAATSGNTAQNAAILTLSDFTRVRIQVAVPEMEASLVATNQPALITAEGLRGPPFAGKITRFSYALDEATRTMLAEIVIPNPKLELRPGMYVSVKIGVELKQNALLLPVDAVVVEKSGVSVFLVADHRARKTAVKTGFNDGTNIEILTGLNPDQPAILVGKRAFGDGQSVRVEAGQ